MLKNHISAGITAVLFCTSMMVNLPNMAAASTSVNLDRDEVVYQREADSQSKKSNFEYVPQEGIRVGYIITGDDSALLDENTMGYIRRILHTKFPGARYPMERMENIDDKSDWHFHQGRRNTGDTFILTEAHDVLSKEFEKLEELYHIKSTSHTDTSSSNGPESVADSYGTNSAIHGNSYDFSNYLSTLPKDDYVQFARELEEEGLGGYDYLVMFNFKPLRTNVVPKYFGKSRQTDFRLSVRAIDVATGKYIERGEYHSRGYSGGTGLHLPILGYLGTGPSWRRAMRRSIIDAMIESFDHMPIGKYSICDNPYCARRQDEIRMEKVFGKSHRHCVKHCNDKTFCDDHMVSYQLDADLPASYVNNEKDQIYTKE
ncbi:MAG: hypothetical protein J6M33_02340 [Anaerovibrio sp.]|nr:hypothetical protein [Anaerovibrio sp.]